MKRDDAREVLQPWSIERRRQLPKNLTFMAHETPRQETKEPLVNFCKTCGHSREVHGVWRDHDFNRPWGVRDKPEPQDLRPVQGQATLSQLLEQYVQRNKEASRGISCSDPLIVSQVINGDDPRLVKALRRAVVGIENTLYEQRHLADGDNCTLAILKQTLPELTAILTQAK